jgi:hypothetical protein
MAMCHAMTFNSNRAVTGKVIDVQVNYQKCRQRKGPKQGAENCAWLEHCI